MCVIFLVSETQEASQEEVVGGGGFPIAVQRSQTQEEAQQETQETFQKEEESEGRFDCPVCAVSVHL